RRPAPWVLAALAAGYFAVGAWLGLGRGAALPEALRLTTRAYLPLFGDGGQLGWLAVGWAPLPAAVQVPLMPLAWWWHPFAAGGLGATAQSALFTAGAVRQLHRTAGELGTGRRVSAAAAALFALHPAIAYAGANGTAEASLLFFLLLATRHLLRWCRGGSANRLAAAGVTLAGAGLCGMPALGAGVAATAAVTAVAYRGADGPVATRRAVAYADALVVALPLLFTTTVRLLIGTLVAGSWGRMVAIGTNPNLLPADADGASGVGATTRIARLAAQSAVLEPFAAALLIVAAVVAVRRRAAPSAAAMTVLAGGYGTAVAVAAIGPGGPWSLGPSTLLVPLTVLAATGLATAGGARSVGRSADRPLGRSSARPVAPRYRRGVAVAVMLAAALPAGAAGLLQRGIAPDEAHTLTAVFTPDRADGAERQRRHRYDTDRGLARWLDAQHLPPRTVLLDTETGFEVVLASRNPRQFAVPAGHGFDELAHDPARRSVRYVVARPREDPLPADRVNQAYPAIARDARLRLVQVEPTGGDLPAWRVYAVR
ncbi:hypothetical protein, partial [Frankia tisae]|uniref:hypothetical protein n=1 Tax=Frankia tisae TaxID=2950104 RepID=UPI0021C0BD36